MGRAMLIICTGTLFAMGFISISTSKQGILLTQNSVNYADYVMAKNSAQSAIQMAMQHINADEDWAETHGEANPWRPVIEGREVELYTIYDESPEYFEADTLRLISNAQYKDITVEVNSLYWMEPFSSLVPDFEGAIALPTGYNSFNVDGNAHQISGISPDGADCVEKPGIVASSQPMISQLPSDLNISGEPTTSVNSELSYEPTDELIERLFNSGNAVAVDGDYADPLGSEENPGVFFVEEGVKLTGQQSEGYGILVIRSGGVMEYEGELEVAGNFEFNGLVIFENAVEFDGRGTPAINGTVLVGNTEDHEDGTIDINLGGDINITYDCEAEKYAKMAAADAVEQNKYTRVVTTEGANYDQ